jgi:hypothetical protein
MRRQTLYFPRKDGKLSAGFGPWEEVTWWEGETDFERAANVLHYRGYDLHELDPASMGKSGDDLGTDP